MPRNLRAGNKLPTLFLNEPLCTDDLLPANIIFIEMPDEEALKSYNGAYDRVFFWGGGDQTLLNTMMHMHLKVPGSRGLYIHG